MQPVKFLTAEELAQLELAGISAREDIVKYTTPHGPTYDDRRIGRMLAREDWVAHAVDAVTELRELRALLATPCETEVNWHNNGHGPRVMFECDGENFMVDANRALSLGAALIRAALESHALEAKGKKL